MGDICARHSESAISNAVALTANARFGIISRLVAHSLQMGEHSDGVVTAVVALGPTPSSRPRSRDRPGFQLQKTTPTFFRSQRRFLYPANNRPWGKFGAQVTTVTRCPSSAHTRQCSNVRLAGALTSGGKLSVKNRMCIRQPTSIAFR